jgi:hypothetical protein
MTRDVMRKAFTPTRGVSLSILAALALTACHPRSTEAPPMPHAAPVPAVDPERLARRAALTAKMELKHVDDYVRDCGYVRMIDVEDGMEPITPGSPSKTDECHRSETFEQDCAPGGHPIDCFEQARQCERRCAGPCETCEAACAATCRDDRARCAGNESCIKNSAERRARCKNDCFADRELCFDACRQRESSCVDESAAIQTKTCPDCDAWRRCAVEADRAGYEQCKTKYPMPDECYSWCTPAG